MLDAPAPAACIAGTWATTPAGVILHGSRSGVEQTTLAEFHGTVAYQQAGARDAAGDNLGWNATIGPGLVALHIDPKHWGWNAREASHQYLAIEFGQPTVNDAIDDSAVAALAWWFVNVARAAWPDLPAVFPTHAELPAGVRDGKTDVFPNGDAIRARLLALLG